MRRGKVRQGFSLLELLVVVAIIGILATLVIVSLSGVVGKARDAKRKHAVGQMGRMLVSGDCYLPDAGAGAYDIADVAAELRTKYPQYAGALANLPKDPKTGTDAATNYLYEVTGDNHCVLYANLENTREEITLPGLAAPAPNSGIGVLQAASVGPNGTPIYYQMSK